MHWEPTRGQAAFGRLSGIQTCGGSGSATTGSSTRPGTMSSRFSYFELLTEAVSTAISDTTYEQVVACSEPRRTKVHR